ncbi:protein MCM10 homolog [Nilaparvata lugens]|uniref:protein MCM10 homolog n=1 Tax=Nilaparvata lugens TaxID=108931 RepID=UPI000B99A924|nr:protein MCM10 homolog [Nilaparvata lugens]
MDDDGLDFLDEFIDNAFEEAEKYDKVANGETLLTPSSSKSKQLKDFNFLAEETQVAESPITKKPTVNAQLTKKQTSNECKKAVPEKSLIHNGDTDDSEDEDNRNPSEKKYNEFGQFVNNKLKEDENSKSGSLSSLFKNTSWKSKTSTEKVILKTSSSVKPSGDSFVSTIGLNIVNPLVQAGSLFEKMAGRTYVHFVKLKYHTERIARKDSEMVNKDWIVIGVVVAKSAAKESKKGNNFCVWTISDLRMGLKTASLFLFGNAYTQLWKRPVGTVIGVLNPTVMDQSQRDNVEACLSVYSADQVMVIGQSKDFGICKARKNNGDRCTMFVNKSSCEVCIYHVEKEYKKFSNRSDLQSPTSGGLQKLRNKVLGKNEVFYAGQSFSAIKSKQSKKTIEKDKNRLRDLFGGCSGQSKFVSNDVTPAAGSSAGPSIEFTRFKKIKDAELLAKLNDTTGEKKASDYDAKDSDKKTSTNRNSKLRSSPKNKENGINSDKTRPKLFSKESLNNVSRKLSGKFEETIDTNMSAKNVLESRRKIMEAEKEMEEKRKASEKCEFSRESLSEFFANKKLSLDNLSVNRSPGVNRKVSGSKQMLLKKCDVPGKPTLTCSGPVMIDLSIPVTRRDRERAKITALNYVKNKGPIKKVDPNEVRDKTAPPKKRSFPDDKEESAEKETTQSSLPARFIELMNKTSKHTDLLDKADEEKFNNYFEKMNKKEEMEEKMLSTYKLPCKAVRCLNCKYTWFSASDLCKSEGHRLKVVDATKRFFRCNNCSHRTISLDIIPLVSCANCGGSNWIRAAMMSEKKTMVNLNQLSIRGGEQKFMNSVECNGNLNLLVPE